MRAYLIWGIFSIAVLGISACATTPKPPQQSQPKPFDEKPGDITFDYPEANVMYEILIAELATQRGNPQIASQFYTDAAKLSKDPRIASRAVRIANFANRKDDALTAAKIWNESEPDNAEPQRVLAVLYLRNGNHEKAQELLRQLLEKEGKDIGRNLLLTGALLQRESKKEDASKIAAYLTTLHPEQAESHYIHASLAIQANQKTAALASIKKALDIRPKWLDAAMLYPRILHENGKSTEALKYLSSYLEKSPEANTLRLAYAQLLVDERQLEKARKQFKLLAVKTPNNTDVLFALAMISMQLGDFDDAAGHLKQLNATDKSSSQIQYYLGQIEEQKENFESAINWYSQVHSGTYFIESRLRISVIIAKTQNIEEARVYLHSIETANDKEKRELVLFEGNLLRDFKHYQAAFDYYSERLTEQPKDIDYLYFRSLVAEKLDMIDTVIADLSYVISKDPDNAAALNALGYTLADRTDKLDEALELIQRAKELEPNDAAIIDSLGWVNFRLGNHDVALKYLKEAMDEIEDGEVAAHYGEVLWAVGQKDKAVDVWAKAKKQFKDNDVLKETLKRFGQ